MSDNRYTWQELEDLLPEDYVLKKEQGRWVVVHVDHQFDDVKEGWLAVYGSSGKRKALINFLKLYRDDV